MNNGNYITVGDLKVQFEGAKNHEIKMLANNEVVNSGRYIEESFSAYVNQCLLDLSIEFGIKFRDIKSARKAFSTLIKITLKSAEYQA
jgi:hypothetical protein